MAKPEPKTKRMTPEEQSERFKETARALGANESPDEMDKVFKKLSIRRQGPYSRGKPVKP